MDRDGLPHFPTPAETFGQQPVNIPNPSSRHSSSGGYRTNGGQQFGAPPQGGYAPPPMNYPSQAGYAPPQNFTSSVHSGSPTSSNFHRQTSTSSQPAAPYPAPITPNPPNAPQMFNPSYNGQYPAGNAPRPRPEINLRTIFNGVDTSGESLWANYLSFGCEIKIGVAWLQNKFAVLLYLAFIYLQSNSNAGNGKLSESELGTALVNGDFTRFNKETVRLMIKMFDRDGDRSINFEEFGNLWRYLRDWRKLFEKFDLDKNGILNYDEFCRALSDFGYSLSHGFIQYMYSVYSSFNRRGERVMSFDMFVQCCINLKSMTDSFKQFDTDRDGYITLGFEQFLLEVMKLK